jgi:signal transduction histidine kinase
MSLKARFRIAIVALTVTIVIGMSALSVHGFIQDSFDRTAEVAEAIASGVQSSTLETLKIRASDLATPPANLEDAKIFWLQTVEHDPAIKDVLVRALGSWHQIAEVFLTDNSGRMRVTSGSKLGTRPAAGAVDFEQWKKRSLLGNIRQVFFQSEDTEFVRTLGAAKQPVLKIHVVISSLFLRNSLKPNLEKLGQLSLAALLISVALALVLPSLVVDPLERLTERIDQMAAGSPVRAKPLVNEAKEFARVHSKLNVLGQQVEGAREDASELRSNVAQLLEQLKEAVLLFDTSGRLMMAGPPSRRLLGWEPEAMVGRRAEEIFPPETAMGMLLQVALEKREAIRDRLVTIKTSGVDHRVLASIEPLVKRAAAAAGGGMGLAQPIGILVALHDAETRGQIEEQLDIAARLNAISQLTRGVAHEIKNPLNAITVHLEVLKNRVGMDAAPELNVIGQEIGRLNRIVKTFLDFHRPVDIRRGRLDLNELICDIARLVEPEAAAHEIEVRCLSFGCPVVIDADRDLLKQAFLNVVMNGLEAMPDGGRLTLCCTRQNAVCRVEISDTGPGIPPEIGDKIFNLYFTTKVKGSGIGLAMAYRFVQLLDGKMTFSSESSRGATFIFELPEASSLQSAETAQFTRSV